MDYKIKVCKIDHRLIFWIFLCLNAIALGCMIATLFVPNWSSFSSSSSDISRDFKGKLLETTETLKESNHARFIDLYYLCTHKTCKFWKNLYIGGSSYIIFECLSIGCTTIWSIILFLFLIKKDYLVSSLFFCAMAWIGHLIAIVTWLSVTEVTYNGDCHNSDNANIDICTEDGPKLSLAILVFITIVNASFLIIARTVIIEKVSYEERRLNSLEDKSEAQLINRNAENDTQFIMKGEISTEKLKATDLLNLTRN
ncbi:unnamed protein product [Blepharisma stoltei]|uniref:Uncharacterized protein n=1 Tax=Blepharisma stoltei TaxID=1481888 RepID=A0AAU9KA56_9CILI|nr:unnamed protein product [Blepharisma stoltei]